MSDSPRTKSSAFHHTGSVGLLFNGDLDGLLGEQLFNEFGPLNEAEATTVEVVFVAHVVDFGEAFDAVEVKVIDGATRGGVVLVDNGKGR